MDVTGPSGGSLARLADGNARNVVEHLERQPSQKHPKTEESEGCNLSPGPFSGNERDQETCRRRRECGCLAEEKPQRRGSGRWNQVALGELPLVLHVTLKTLVRDRSQRHDPNQRQDAEQVCGTLILGMGGLHQGGGGKSGQTWLRKLRNRFCMLMSLRRRAWYSPIDRHPPRSRSTSGPDTRCEV